MVEEAFSLKDSVGLFIPASFEDGQHGTQSESEVILCVHLNVTPLFEEGLELFIFLSGLA